MTMTEALAEERRRIQGIRDKGGGGSRLTTGPVDWQQQRSFDCPCYRVDNSNTVLSLSICSLVLIFFHQIPFSPFDARNPISTAIVWKIFLYQVYTNLAYVPPMYRIFKNYEFSLSIMTYVNP